MARPRRMRWALQLSRTASAVREGRITAEQALDAVWAAFETYLREITLYEYWPDAWYLSPDEGVYYDAHHWWNTRGPNQKAAEILVGFRDILSSKPSARRFAESKALLAVIEALGELARNLH